MAADLPRNYEAALDAFQFIRDVPTDWEQSQALQGEIGEFIVMARQDRHSPDWYLGAMTNEQPRELLLPLTFLEAGKRYRAEIYQDGPEAHWYDNPTDYAITHKNVDAMSVLTVPLAAGGGLAIRFVAL